MPEGYTLDKAVVAEVTPIFKSLNLTQDQAQQLVTFHTKQLLAAAKAPESTYNELRTSWQAEVTADPEIKAYTIDGRTGLDAVKVDVGRALASLGDAKLAADFRAAMDLTGAGDNPAFIKTFWKLAQKVVEGKPVAGTNPSPLGQRDPSKPVRPSAANALYPNLP